MASASPLRDIDEQFLQCSICLDRLAEPKMLPCLHHFCRKCLHDTFQKNKKKDQEATKIECPTCRGEHNLPEKGVDGFKTDFNTKNIIEFIQLHESVEDAPSKVCIHCTKKLRASGYCFRCNDFLCGDCHEHHITNAIVKDHRPHVFSLGDVAAKNLTVDKLASLREAPRCLKHPGKLSELCCNSCDNLPICMACSYGAHKGHDLREVSALAEEERAKLSGKMDGLMRFKGKIYGMQKKVGSAAISLSRIVQEKGRELQETYNQRQEGIKMEVRRIDEQFTKERSRVEETLNEKMATRKRYLEEEMRIAQERYDRGYEEDKRETDMEFKKMQKEYDKKKAEWEKKLEAITTEFQELMTSLKDQQQEHSEEIRRMSDHCKDIVKRFENVTKIAASIVAANNDWTDVQCIPDVCSAVDPLMGEVGEEFPDLAKLTDVSVGGLSAVVKDRVVLSTREESIVDIEGLGGVEWQIHGITGTDDGKLIITGSSSDEEQSFISVISMDGKRLSRHFFDSARVLWRYCNSLQQSKIVTACYPDEIGIFDARNGEYIKTNVSHITKTLEPSWYIRCLAMNPVNNDIILGCGHSRNMYVFDAKMKYTKTLKLPDKKGAGARYITVHGDNLLVCDWSSKVYAVTMKGPECKLMYEFTEPRVSGTTCGYPSSVCTDKNGFIYMLCSGSPKLVLAQYSQDGSQLLATRLVDEDDPSKCMPIATVDTDQGEKLLIATSSSWKLITYGLS